MLTVDDHWCSLMISDDDGDDHLSLMITMMINDDHWCWWSLTTDDDHWSLMMINFIYVGDDLWESIMLSLFSGDHHCHLLSSDNHYVLVSSLTIVVIFYLWWSSVWMPNVKFLPSSDCPYHTIPYNTIAYFKYLILVISDRTYNSTTI